MTDLEVGDLYDEHNEGWQHDSSRCPMYMNEIYEVDERWSCEDLECLDMFHKKRTIQLMLKFIEEIGMDAYRTLCDIFLQVKESGYTEEELYAEDLRFILRDADREEIAA